MTVPVLTAVTDTAWEADLVSAYDRGDMGVRVVRRCVDLADLLAAAASGTARVVIVSADLRRLDREALARLADAGLAVVGLTGVGDEAGLMRLRQLGIVHVVRADWGAEAIRDAAILAAEAFTAQPQPARQGQPPASATPERTADPHLWPIAGGDRGFIDPGQLIEPAPPADPEDGLGRLDPLSTPGRLVAVWGPTGAPGRTTVAVALAAELAHLEVATLLADADTYGGVVAQVLGLLDEAPGLAAAVRQANTGSLDLLALARLATTVGPHLRVLTGIARADRWPELRPSGLEVVYGLARALAAVTVVDCAFCLEQDEELMYDTAAPRRNGATLATIEMADLVVVVGSADPVGLQRLVRGLAQLQEVAPDVAPTVVVNRLRKGPIHGDVEAQVRSALERHAGVSEVVVVPEDSSSLNRSMATGRTLVECAPGSSARLALAGLARSVAAELGVGGRGARPRRRSKRAAARRAGSEGWKIRV